MNNVQRATEMDFYVTTTAGDESSARNTMNLVVEEPISLVLFYAPECPYSQVILPLYQELVNSIVGCRFFQVDICENPRIVTLSVGTTFPLIVVPTMILFHYGVPHQLLTDNDVSMTQLKEILLNSTRGLTF